MAAIELRDVTKQFGQVVAVNALTLDVLEGSIYGFIGPNGSGKTTTIRMIMNLLVPDHGLVRVLGQSPGSAVRDLVGYLPEERGLYKRMTGRQVLRYYGQLKGRSTSEVDAAVAEWIEPLQVGDWLDKKVQALSKGMSQKVQFLSTIVVRPKLLILDEPFSGLDPVNADLVRSAVLELRRRGTTIVFSTHDMAAAEGLCDRIFMIFLGRKVLDGSLDEIQARYGQDTIRVRTAAGPAALQGLAGVEAVTDFGNYQDVRFTGDSQVLLGSLAARTAVRHFEVTTPSLNDIFIRIAKPPAAQATAQGQATGAARFAGVGR
jgi:ABC-2 type transport system ATP-binding protein